MRAYSTGVARARPAAGACRAVVRPQVALVGASRITFRRRTMLVMNAAGVAHPGEEASDLGEIRGAMSPMMGVPDVTMAKGGGQNMGSGGSLGMVMEKSKLQFVMPTPPQQSPKLDDGGSGGDDGKHINNGGGGGDGDDGDDDDYFGEGDDPEGDGQGGGGDGFFRTALPELYDRVSIQVVLAEWFKTIADLPIFIRRAVEMGLFSSAQLVRFLSMDVRPNVTRSVSRTLPPEWARSFVGRMMADPAFTHKLVFEQLLAFTSSMLYEWRLRGDNFKKELDLALINSMGMAAAVGATVWITAPSRAYGSVHKFPWQSMLANLPHCVFDASGPLRSYTKTARLGGFFASMAQLSAVGAIAGGATALASSAAVKAHQHFDPEYQPSTAVPDAARSSAGLGAFFAVNANTRYQLLGGMDRYLFGHSNFMWTYMLFSGVARSMLSTAGELSRPIWQGLPSVGPVWEPQGQRRRQTARVKRVRKKKVAKDADAIIGDALATSSSVLPAAAAAVAVAGGAAVAAGAPDAAQQQQMSGELSSSPEAVAAAAVALQDYQPISAADQMSVERLDAVERADGSVEEVVEQQLTRAPAVMGGTSNDMLGALIQEAAEYQLRQQREAGLADAAMGVAVRDAVAQAVA